MKWIFNIFIKAILFTQLYVYIFIAFIFKKLLPPKKNKSGILFLAAFFEGNAGFHWRVKKWSEILTENSYEVEINTVFDKEDFYHNLKNNHALFLIKFLNRRFWQVIKSRNYEVVIVRRELLLFNDYGNLFLEKLLLHFNPDAILDIDDDLSAAKEQPKKITNKFAKLLLEDGDKFNNSLKLYKRFIVASTYLKEKIQSINLNSRSENICIVPTCVDYDKYEQKKYIKPLNEVTFGWVGSNNNYVMLDLLLPLFEKLFHNYKFKLIIIGGDYYDRKTTFPKEFIKWSLKNEIEHLKKIDIGLMPLIHDNESKGKAGFKLIQYMGLGIVSVASAITINNEIISDNVDSFLCASTEEWEKVFISIIEGKYDLTVKGDLARKKISENYTFNSNKKNYINFIEYVRNSRNFVE